MVLQSIDDFDPQISAIVTIKLGYCFAFDPLGSDIVQEMLHCLLLQSHAVIL